MCVLGLGGSEWLCFSVVASVQLGWGLNIRDWGQGVCVGGCGVCSNWEGFWAAWYSACLALSAQG